MDHSSPLLLNVMIQFSLVTQSCLTLCDPMDCSIPGFPVLHHLPGFVQTQVHRVCDAIQPSHPVVPFSSRLQSFPASGSFLVSRLFASGGQRIGVSASVLPMNIHDGFPLQCTGLISFGDFTEDYSLGNSLSESLEGLSQRGMGGARMYTNFCKNRQT